MLQEKVIKTIEKYNLIDKEDKVVVGVSGGPDSITLLSVLHNIGINVIVCHINHGLRENALLDEEYVKNYCDKRNIKFYVKHIDLKNKELLNGMSTEEAGRKARYDFFNKILIKENANKIATAHNLNDNVETVLLNMFRGSGVGGLKGILPKSDNIIRPLIECSREEIEDYCASNNLNPRHDESNDETLYTRNKVRLELIPYLTNNINSNVINNIARMASIVAEQEEYINSKVQEAYNEVIVASNARRYEQNEDQDVVTATASCHENEHPDIVTATIGRHENEHPDIVTATIGRHENEHPDIVTTTIGRHEECLPSICYNLKKFNKLPILIRKRLILKGIFNVLGNVKDIEKVHIDDIVKMCENNVGGKFLTPKKFLKVSVNNHKIYIEKL